VKPPAKCPYCGSPMLNDYTDSLINATLLNQSCVMHLDHAIKIRSHADNKNYRVHTIMVRIAIGPPGTWAMWNLDELTLVVAKGSLLTPEGMRNRGTSVPFFVPNLSDYPKLVDKIKTYIVFT
jgi:hypothetical protein